MSNIRHPFAFGARAIIDGDESLRAVVVGFLYRPAGEVQVELSWLHGGQLHTQWLPASRLTPPKDGS